MTEGYSGREAADIVGITCRQLDYWARTDLIRPSLADAKGSGSRRRYSYRDLVELRMIKTLLDSGGHPSQMLAHRDIGVRPVAVMVGIKLSGRNRVLQLDKLTIRAAHHNQRRQWRVALALSGKPAGKSLHPKIQDWLKIAVPANPAG